MGLSITSGTFQVEVSNASFDFDQVSQSIMIEGAGPGSGTLISKVQEIFHSGSASIEDSAFTTVSNNKYFQGTDHRETIQRMLNDAASATESLRARTATLPAGTFLVDITTSSLEIQDNVIFEGAGIGATTLVAFGGNSGQLIRHSESINRDFVIRDMTLNGAKDFFTGSLGSTLIQLDSATGFDFSNLAIISASGDAVSITGSADGTFRNIRQRANDRNDTAITSSARLALSDVNTQGSLGFGLSLVGTVSTSLVNVDLDSGGDGDLFEGPGTAGTSFVNFGDARFRTNDLVVFGTSVFANPADQLEEYFVGTVPFKSKGQAHAFQTVSGSRTWLQFPLIVNNEITGSELLANAHPGLAWVMDYVAGDKVGTDQQFIALMGPGVAGPESSRLTPNPAFGWTAFYTCSLLSGSQQWSGSAFEFKQGHVTAPAFSGSFSGDGEGITGVISSSHALRAVSASHALRAVTASHALDYDGDISASQVSPGTFQAGDFEFAGNVTASEFSGALEPMTTAINFFNGDSPESIDVNIISNGITVSASIEKSGGGDLQFFFTGSLHGFDTTPARQVALSVGSDTLPTLNFIYVTGSGGPLQLTTSTVNWPTGPHAAVATALIQSAASVENDGAYKLHAWTNHLNGADQNGHQSHVSRKLRLNADWDSGVALTTTGSAAVPATWLQTTEGVVFQLHNISVRALDMVAGNQIYVANDPTTPFARITNLGELTQDAEGVGLINNRYYNFVIWGSAGEDDINTQFYLNLPDGNYVVESQAQNDDAATAIFTIPGAFKGTAFLIARITMKMNSSGEPWTESLITDLRGQLPSAAPGGGTSISDHGGLSGLLDDDHPQYLLASGTRPLSAEWNAGAEISSSFRGAFDGVIPSGSKVYGALVNGGIQSSSYTQSFENSTRMRIEVGASIGIDFSGMPAGQDVYFEIQNAGNHEVTLPGSGSGLVWTNGLTGCVDDGLNILTLIEMFNGTFAEVRNDIS